MIMQNADLERLPPATDTRQAWPWTGTLPTLPPTAPNGLPWPKITIVTPSFNQGQFIEKTIRSVLLQGYPNLEYIIMDGGSRDNTVEIIRKYDPWITHWVSEPDGGQANAINRGWRLATGQVLHWLNSDDYLLPDALAKIGRAFAVADPPQVVSGACLLTNAQDVAFASKPAVDFDVAHFCQGGKCPGQPAVFLSAALVRQVGELDPQLNNTMDWEYWLRISQIQPPVKAVKHPDSLAVWYQWEDCKSLKLRVKSYEERLAVLQRWFAQPDLAPSIKRLTHPAYSSSHGLLALALAATGQPQEATKQALTGFKYQPSLRSLGILLKSVGAQFRIRQR